MTSDTEFLREQLRITCVDSIGLLTEYLEHALAGADRTRLERHLEGCEACAVYLDQLRTTVTVVGSVKAEESYEVGEATMDALLDMYERWARPER